MKTKNYYFTFGVGHSHHEGGRTWIPSIVCRIQASNGKAARTRMFERFGDKWAFMYTASTMDMSFYNEIRDIDTYEVVEMD